MRRFIVGASAAVTGGVLLISAVSSEHDGWAPVSHAHEIDQNLKQTVIVGVDPLGATAENPLGLMERPMR